MDVQFGNTNKRKNSTRIPTFAITIGDCNLKSPVSIVNPILTIQYNGFPDYNCCYIEMFHRYYFIDDIINTARDQWDIYCVVDVLATYKTGVLNTSAFVEYSANGGNNSLPDTRLPISACYDIIGEGSEEIPGYYAPGSYIVTIAGAPILATNGMSTTYVLTGAEMASLGRKLYEDSALEELKKYFDNPSALLISSYWIPISASELGTSAQTIKIGQYDTGVSGTIARETKRVSLGFDIPLKYFTENPATGDRNYNDYRNVEPYTELTVYLPGSGLVNIPLVSLFQKGKSAYRVTIRSNISCTTGDITHFIECGTDQPIMIAHGSLGVQVPLSVSNGDTPGALSGAMQVLAGAGVTAIGGFSGNPLLMAGGIGTMVGGAMSGAIKAEQRLYSVSGTIGGKESADFNQYYRMRLINYPVSGSPSAVGQPTFNTIRLGSLSGYCKCSGAYIGVQATDQEHNALMALVNGGFYIE